MAERRAVTVGTLMNGETLTPRKLQVFIAALSYTPNRAGVLEPGPL